MRRGAGAAPGVARAEFSAARRAARAAAALDGAATVTEAIYDGGFESSGRFYAEAPARLGMTPTARRRGGAGETIRFAVGRCSLGAVLVAATAKGIAAITLGDDPEALVRDLQDRFPLAELVGGDQHRLALHPPRRLAAGAKRHLADDPPAEHPAVRVEVARHCRCPDHRSTAVLAQASIPSGASTSRLNACISRAPSAPSMARWSKLPVALITVAICRLSLIT